jgi:hypothetical protein
MRKIKLTLLMGILAILTLTPSCSKSGGSNGQFLALAAILVWTSPVAQYLLPRHGTYPREIEKIVLQHKGSAGDVKFDLKDPSDSLQATPSSGVLKPGEQVIISIVALALVAYTTTTLTMTCQYADAVSLDKLVVPFAFALMPPAAFVMSLISGSDPQVFKLFLAGLIFGAIAKVVQYSRAGTLRNRTPLLRYTEIVLLALITMALTAENFGANFYRSVNSPEASLAVNFPPGQGGIGYTLHANKEVDMAPGEFYMFSSMMQRPIPIEDSEPKNLHTYAFVIDSDGAAANNWKPAPAFPNDFWKDTDRWYQITYSKADGWKMIVSQVDANNKVTEVASAARAIIVDDAIVLVVPKSEIPGPNAKWRATTFVHQGDFGFNFPYVWSGDVERPVDQPLHDVK